MSQQKDLRNALKDLSVTSTTFSAVEVQILSVIEKVIGRTITIRDLIGHREVRRLSPGVYSGSISINGGNESFRFCLREKTRKVYYPSDPWSQVGRVCNFCDQDQVVFIPIARAIFDWGDEYELDEPRIHGYDSWGVGHEQRVQTSIILMRSPGHLPNSVHYFAHHLGEPEFFEKPIGIDRRQRDHDEYWEELWGGKIPPSLMTHAKYYTD